MGYVENKAWIHIDIFCNLIVFSNKRLFNGAMKPK